ncbi:LysR family transcriptional regulator [Thauera sinica]|uniref:LysR family transcriptional regulator n=1 Tax=Thauera sinica TaxID=2665146 RepID=A0ABW1APU7_9RHOO|nr:LysR family transcriptional regulator [Thauera sp. K11]ATE62240.1 LysR family transcriptional regulator [Thauera sp. K11]
MNRLDAMGLFVRVADLGSFAAVASQLGVARSVVTRHIAALEEHLGVKLIVRTTRRLTLTTAGAGYLEKCRTILDLVEAAEADVMEERLTPRGNLRMGLPLSFGLKRIMPLLPEFQKTCPEINLALDFTDRHINLIDEGVDLSIRVTARLDPGDVARKIGDCRLLAVASPDYLSRHGRPRHPSELAAHRCLGYSAKANNRPWLFTVDGQPQSVYLPFRLQANNGDALALAAAQGLGITMQPDFIAADYLASGAVETLLEDFEPPPLGIYALLPSNHYLPGRVRVLIDFLAARLSGRP